MQDSVDAVTFAELIIDHGDVLVDDLIVQPVARTQGLNVFVQDVEGAVGCFE